MVFQIKRGEKLKTESKIGKTPWACEKHRQALGSDFAKCAICPGTSGKVEDGKMRCSRAGATPELVTPEQAWACNGTKPNIAAQNEHEVHFLVLRPVRKPVENQVNVSV